MNLRVLGVKNHQMLSFNKTFAMMQAGEVVFWPGCAMLSYGKEVNDAVFKLLSRKIPNLAISTFCCGNPSMHIDGGKNFGKRINAIEKTLQDNSVKLIYTLCPNCFVTLSEHTDIEVKSAWALLDNALPQERFGSLENRCFTIHDPCPIVKDIEAADHVRNILKKLGAELVEFERNREKTMCCGKKNMIMALEPSKGQKIFNARARQVKTDEVVTYCAACVDTFRNNDFRTHHILELMFDIKANSSWMNRFIAVDHFRRNL